MPKNKEMKENKMVIFLDLWETLLISNPNSKNINHDRGEIINNITNMYDSIFWEKQIIEEIKEFKTEETKGISIKPLQRVQKLLEKNNVSSKYASDIINQFDKLIIKKYIPKLNLDLLNSIKDKGKDIYIISNSGLTTKYAIIEILKYYNVLELFKDTFFSEDYEYCKPNTLFYRIILEKNNLKSEDVLMIGDNEKMDYEPCRKLGIKCIIKKWSNM